MLLVPLAFAAPPPPVDLAGLLNMGEPAEVLVGRDRLAPMVPDLAIASGPESTLTGLLRARAVRQCYATVLERRPAWAAVAAVALEVSAEGVVSPQVYGTRAITGLEAGWHDEPSFTTCLTSALKGVKVAAPGAAAHWTLEATFRPIVELSTLPEGTPVMGFSTP